MTARRGGPVRRAAGEPGRGRPAADGRAAPSSTTSSCPGMLHACFVRSPHPRARIISIDATAALRLPGVQAVFTAADLNGDVREAWYTGTGNQVPETPRPPLAEGEARFVGRPGRARRGRQPLRGRGRGRAGRGGLRAAARGGRLPQPPSTSEALVHEGYPGNVAAELAGAPAATLADAFAAAAHVVAETICEQACAAVPMETRGIVADWSAASGELTIWAATQAPHEVRMFCARLLGLAEHRVRVIARDVGGGFGQKVMVAARGDVRAAGGRSCRPPVKWIEDRQENLMAAGQARHEHGTSGWRSTTEGSSSAATIDHVQDVGAYPDAVAGRHRRRRRRMNFPGPYRVPRASFSHATVYTNTVGRGRLPGPVGVRVAGPRGGARHRRPPDGGRPGRAAPPQPAERGRHAVHQPQRHALRPASPRSRRSSRRWRSSTTTAFRAEQAAARAAGPLPRRRHVLLRRADRPPRSATTRPRARRSASSRRGKVNVYVAGGSTGNSLETTVVQLAADALGVGPRRRGRRSRATPRVTRSGPGPAAAAAGR